MFAVKRKKMGENEFLSLIERIKSAQKVEKEEWAFLISSLTGEQREQLAANAREVAFSNFGKGVYVRGLVEISSYCKNNCYYCGLRCANKAASRYRLSKEEILECCREGASLGFNTFVLQGGEDPVQNDAFITDVVAALHNEFPAKAITLSVGERSREAYEAFRKAGATRYLLRHETRSVEHYARLHPSAMSADNRRSCLFALRELGYQAGSGFMVGSPGQSVENLVDDILFLEELQPQMIGIGPFIPAAGTPFGNFAAGSAEQTLLLLSLLRLRFPQALIPATTALSTLLPDGVERGVLAGANVVMPNLSPQGVREKYSIYNNKKISGCESAQQLDFLARRLRAIDYCIDYSRGDYPSL